MASVESNSNDGVISKQLLKSKSGEFDVESIHTLNIKDAGISDVGCIGECTSLERLDLSYNNVSRLHKLAGLSALVKLNLAANRISSLEGLQSLENLQSLNVSGNLIGSVDCLRYLAGLEKFTSLRLQDPANGLSNPMCNMSYLDGVLMMLPVLITLDGQRVRGRGSELFQLCKHMDQAMYNFKSVNASSMPEVGHDATHDVDSQQWMLDIGGEAKVQEAEENLRAMLDGCKQLSNKAALVLYDSEEARPTDTSEISS
ncbi:leucine-rich repeat-containing protein 61 [Aplysia californica]|uniref:Leucine-rich repeat-containing protein 61 n=1 Tax=Aplysia californica TaxID=6500 RepID=A0ABM0JE51_APLCA|nr:leucine-rich repeat-containing protein 61 [Aplysia californica]